MGEKNSPQPREEQLAEHVKAERERDHATRDEPLPGSREEQLRND